MHWVSGALWLSPRAGITGPIPREADFEDAGGSFFLDPQGMRADPVEDDLALWVSTDRGLVVCTGCSHAGLVNTLNYVRRFARQDKVRAVIGGFHLLNAGERRIEQTLTTLKTLSPERVVPCHCTGDRFVKLAVDALGGRVTPGRAGAVCEF
jgi:7,8-dihydropterin-6-yl-methyl-4-(beta-D-ribofuranosyl)aminobenzene 5'-phosphate synthase